MHQSLGEILPIDEVFIFSMGLQWAICHAPELFDQPCILASPSIAYDHIQLNHMMDGLQKSMKSTLVAFYRKSCVTNWWWWKSTHLNQHLKYNQVKILKDWLHKYGRMQVEIPNRKTIQIYLATNDPIGEKPTKRSDQAAVYSTYQGDHIITPQQMSQMLH